MYYLSISRILKGHLYVFVERLTVISLITIDFDCYLICWNDGCTLPKTRNIFVGLVVIILTRNIVQLLVNHTWIEVRSTELLHT
jgi:hypothetical protein